MTPSEKAREWCERLNLTRADLEKMHKRAEAWAAAHPNAALREAFEAGEQSWKDIEDGKSKAERP
jgi:hypothetical protein